MDFPKLIINNGRFVEFKDLRFIACSHWNDLTKTEYEYISITLKLDYKTISKLIYFFNSFLNVLFSRRKILHLGSCLVTRPCLVADFNLSAKGALS